MQNDPNITDYLEPEDYEGMLKASAFDLSEEPYEEGYDDYSGWGHLEANTIFDMLNDGYKVYHFSTTKDIVSTDWGEIVSPFYWISQGRLKNQEYFNSEFYLGCQSKTITSIITLPNIFYRNTENKLYVWGRSGRGEPCGYSLANPNYFTGYTRVTSGTDGDENNDGIIHNSLDVAVTTYQYRCYKNLQPPPIPYHYFPYDNFLGFNISVFGKIDPMSSAGTSQSYGELTLQIYPNPIESRATLNIELQDAAPLIVEVYNTLGIKVSEQRKNIMNAGSHLFELDLSHLPAGIYFCKASSNYKIGFIKFAIGR